MGLWIIAAALLAAGVLCAAAGWRRLRGEAALRRAPERASGEVARVGRRWWPMLLDPLSGPVRRPIVRFQTAAGQQVEADLSWAGTGAPGDPGDTVSVLYDPADPTNARLDTPDGAASSGGAALVVFGGLALAIVGILLGALAAATT